MPNDITVTKNTTSGSERWDIEYTVDQPGTISKNLLTAGKLADRNEKVSITTPSGSATTPTTSVTLDSKSMNINSSTGVVTSTMSGSANITPTISAGYINAGTAGTVSASGSQTLQLTTQSGATVTPTTTEQTAVSAGRYTLGAIKVAGDANLVAGNIKTGVSIFGVNGSYSGQSINNQQKSVTPTTSVQTVTPDSGYTGLSEVEVEAIPNQSANPFLALTGVSSDSNVYYIAATHYDSDEVTPLPFYSTSGGVTVYFPRVLMGDATTSDVLYGKTFTSANGVGITGTMTNNGALGGTISTQNGTYTIPAGYTSGGTITATLPAMTLPTAASSSYSGTSKATISRSTSDQYINIPTGYNGSAAYYKISAVPNGSVTAPSTISGSSASVSTGTNTITLSKTVSVTPSVTTAGYISSGTAGNSSVSLTASVTTKGATIYHPSSSAQSIASGTYLTGAQTINAVTTSELTAANIKDGTTVKIGDSSDDDCVTSVTGTFTDASTVSTGQNAAAAGQILSGYSAWVDGAEVQGNIATVAVSTPTVSIAAAYTPARIVSTNTQSAGYTAGGTTSNFIEAGKLASTTYIPTTSDQTIANSGLYLVMGSAGLKVAGDANLIASNIKDGVTIFGVTGTMQSGSVVMSTTQDSHGGDILTITSGVNTIYLQSKTATPTESQQTISPDTGNTGLSEVIVGAISPTYIGSGVAQRTASDVIVTNGNVNVPVGYYGTAVTKSYPGYGLITSKEYTISHSSTTNTLHDTIALGSSCYTSNKILYVKVRDKAGPRNGYFTGTDTYFYNYYAARNATTTLGTANGDKLVTVHRMSSSGQLTSYGVASAAAYGVYGYSIDSSGNLTIYKAYRNTYSLTINGTYVVEVYLLDYPSNGNPYSYSYS